MERKQVFELVNLATKEAIGIENILQEDLDGVVDTGKAITEILNAGALDNYTKALFNHIGKVVFVNRVYSGALANIVMDSMEYGSILEKVSVKTPEATENETWELQDGASYDPNIFYQPKITVKFFNKRVTFEVPYSIAEKQVKESFSNAEQLNSFVSAIYNAVDRSMTIKIDALSKRAINNMIGETFYSEMSDGTYTNKSGVRVVNLLKLYNDTIAPVTPLTADKCLTDAEFIRFASREMGLYVDRLKEMSTLFNIGGEDRFTPRDLLHIVLLSEFEKSAGAYLYSDTFNKEYAMLPKADTVAYWQGSGKKYDFADTSAINVQTSDGHVVNATGILGVMFDRDAVGVTNFDKRTTTNYNPKAEFYSNWFKFDAGYFNDLNENFVVFYVA